LYEGIRLWREETDTTADCRKGNKKHTISERKKYQRRYDDGLQINV